MVTKASRFCNERPAALLISDWQWRPFTNYWLLADSTAYGRLSSVLAIPCRAGAVSWHYPGRHVVWAETNRGALANSGYFSSRQQPCAVDLGYEWSGGHDDVYVWWDWHALRWFQWGNNRFQMPWNLKIMADIPYGGALGWGGLLITTIYLRDFGLTFVKKSSTFVEGAYYQNLTAFVVVALCTCRYNKPLDRMSAKECEEDFRFSRKHDFTLVDHFCVVFFLCVKTSLLC